MLINIFFILFF